MLEDRHLLSATADVVILMDNSLSSTGVSRTDFAGELVRVVEQRLVSRGIGGQPTQDHDASTSDAGYLGAAANRYRVVDWASVFPADHFVHPWENAVDAAMTLEATVLTGEFEDGWEAVHYASGGSPQSLLKGQTTDLQFRDNAAVHFILVTDSPAFDGTRDSTLGPDLYFRGNDEHGFSATMNDMLASLEMSTLGGNMVSDAVVTIIAGADFYEDAFPSFAGVNRVLFGVDVDFQDAWDVEMRMPTPPGSNLTDQSTAFYVQRQYVPGSTTVTELEWVTASSNDSADEISIVSSHEFYLGDSIMFRPTNLPGGLSSSEVYYVINREDLTNGAVDIGDRFQLSLAMGGPPVSISSNEAAAEVILPAKAIQVADEFTPDRNYQEMDEFLFNEDFINANGNPAYPPRSAGVHQGNEPWNDFVYQGELYAYLAWASGGTFWDYHPLTESGSTLDSPEVNLLMQVMAMDMFDKIATQVTDFNGNRFAVDLWNFTSVVGDIEDVNLLIGAMQNGGNLDVYDLDADNDIDVYDLARLVVLLYYTRMGDANLDGIVDASDLNAVGENWNSINIGGWADGDFNGDGVVNGNDLNFIGVNWQQEHP